MPRTVANLGLASLLMLLLALLAACTQPLLVVPTRTVEPLPTATVPQPLATPLAQAPAPARAVGPASGPTNAAAPRAGDARAFWVDVETIAWNNPNAVQVELHFAPEADLSVPDSAGSGLALTRAGKLSNDSYAKFPNLEGYDAWQLEPADLDLVPAILKSQMAVAAYDAAGNLVDSTGIQIQGVLDDLYATDADLGVTYQDDVPSVSVWAPTARSVRLLRFADPTTPVSTTHPMIPDSPSPGVWSITAPDGSWDRHYYLFEVEVFVPQTGRFERNRVTDPYAVSLSQDSRRSQFVNLFGDPSLEPPGWRELAKPPLAAPEDITVYEMHVRDFSIGDETVAAPDRGTFKAFTYDGRTGRPGPSAGVTHLLNLQRAGLTHVHLLPVADFASVPEDPAARSEPDATQLAQHPPDSDRQQSAVAQTRRQDGFNWGYDPFHYGVPEGSYATSQDGPARILEFREMVQALNENGLRVFLDVVYNHTFAAGQQRQSVLDKIVPGYYYRSDNNGVRQDSSCCADTASEFAMMEKLMVDTVVRWATAYQVDGFRFDLMNLHTVENALAVTEAVQALTPQEDGVDGSSIYIYGEGWDFGSARDRGLNYAKQASMAGTGIGTFNDKIRDAVHGGYSTDPAEIRRQGFTNGLHIEPNGFPYGKQDLGELRFQMDRMRVGLAGSLQSYPLVDQNGNVILGGDLAGTGYTLDPQETVNYVSKHDNETLFDQNAFKLPPGTPMAERVRVQNLALSIVGLAQGVPFFQMGSDMLRSKSLDRNSYDSGDWFNRVDFSYSSNNFGVGLPPNWDNLGRWHIMRPLLDDPNLRPDPEDIQRSVAYLQEIMQIRSSSKLFRLETAEDIEARVRFHNTGPDQIGGLIVMSISDQVGQELDPDHEALYVLFNASRSTQRFALSDLAGNQNMQLHPVLQDSHDPVVRQAKFDPAIGQFVVPPRTTAVFVDVSPHFIDLDGVLDAETTYGEPIADDAGDDLDQAIDGWVGSQWADLTGLYCHNDAQALYVYVDLDDGNGQGYDQELSSGQLGLLIDKNSPAGGSADPWGNALAFEHGTRPDFVIRGNIPGSAASDDANDGWTELRSWDGAAWTDGGSNWGSFGESQVGDTIAYADGQGVEFRIPLRHLGIDWVKEGDSINLQAFTTQGGRNKGAYDTVPSDDQSVGWDDATSLDQWATCPLIPTEPSAGETALANPQPDDVPRTAFVHLFEWRWPDIARECEEWLGPKGFKAVQISPPNEHLAPDFRADNPWWVRYQPHSYDLVSRSGDLAEFQDMVNRCHAAGVEVYADAVINHMSATDAPGMNGTWPGTSKYDWPGLYAFDDFHHCTPPEIQQGDYQNDAWRVRHCELSGLPDLATEKPFVRDQIVGYLNALRALGVDGFRFDAAKHMEPMDMEQIVQAVDGDPYIFQEVIDPGFESSPSSAYQNIADVTEFRYSMRLGTILAEGFLSQLRDFGRDWLPSDRAVVFVDNHDNQRGHGAGGANIRRFHYTDEYELANIFMLAHPYGYPKIMSSYYFAEPPAGTSPNGLKNENQGPPANVKGETAEARCTEGEDRPYDPVGWQCEHRWRAIANMVGFRNHTDGAGVSNWWSNGPQSDQIAFERTGRGFLAINGGTLPLVKDESINPQWNGGAFVTTMPSGDYCDVIHGELLADGTGCTGPIITVEPDGDINTTVAPGDAFAIHVGARVR